MTTGLDQPPSGGCVLKRPLDRAAVDLIGPAAFGRLCVETMQITHFCSFSRPAAFGRLCVETPVEQIIMTVNIASRLRAAVC